MIPEAQIEQHLALLEETLTHLRACRETFDDEGIKRQPNLLPSKWLFGVFTTNRK